MKRAALLFCLLLLNGCSAPASRPIGYFELQTPRPFGYWVGDQIQHRIVLETQADVRLDMSSLPKQGAINRWLNLNQATVESGSGNNRTVIELEYQVFYAANEVKMLDIPGFVLRFVRDGKTVEQAVPAWHFTLSPLKELAIRKDADGRYYMRPDARPAPLPSTAERFGLYAGLSLSLASAAYLAYLYGYFPAWPKRRIFKRAMAELAGLSERDLPRALAVMHHALNTLYGQALYKHRLDAFYQNHPEYLAAAGKIGWFFDFSNRVLFAGYREYGTREAGELLALCRLCREIERGSR
ncbi:hypothetical protein [Methylomonas methanica]|uniref:MxaA protein, putative n=1 Tax=Methylomonas methanica (strain DSM 25384 / MC09) TaxID=857087 RepID=G0A315_METMM|nr:hypothetical protein [Methylomonas methanica]AEG02674.1 MxaA protein, putative [Methylomonas methanica MC09]